MIESTPVFMEFEIVTPQTFPWGLRCCECHREIKVGQPFASRVESMNEDGGTGGILICVYCEV